MRPLSAIDAIGPAWSHTSRLLIAPRSWRLALKIGAVAFFAEVGGCNGSYSSPGHHSHGVPPTMVAAMVAAALLIGIVAIVVGLAFFYLSSRLQFVLFEIVLRSDTTVAPIWRRYGRATWYWIGLKILFFLTALLCVTPILIPVAILFIHRIGPAFQEGFQRNPAIFVVAILGFVSAVFLVFIVIFVIYTLLRDFGLPSMALESTPMSETVRRVWRLLRGEPGPVALYVLMRFLLSIAGSIAADVVLVIGALIALIPLGGSALIAWLSLRHASLTGHIVMIAAWVVLALAFLALVLVAAIILVGYVFTFLQAYALYFLGGRYPLVGAYLEPFLPPLYAYPRVPPMGAPPAPPMKPPSLPLEGEP
jgi:hypothetical protein